VKRILLLFLVSLSSFLVPAQNMILGAHDLPGLAVMSTDSFTGSNLYGYINGGADLYLEYGFQKVVVSEYAAGEENLKLEVWVMDDSASAFGIYALSTFRCIARDGLSSFSCESKYQSAAAFGNVFISAVNRSGSERGREMCNDMVRKVVSRNPAKELSLPSMFLEDRFASQRSTVRYYKGPLGIQNGIPEWSELFNGVTFSMFTLQIPSEHGTGTIAIITFADSGSMDLFLANSGLAEAKPGTPVERDSGLFYSYHLTGDHTLVFYESQDSTLFYQR